MDKTCVTCRLTFHVQPSRAHIKNCSYECNKVWRKQEADRQRELTVQCACGCGQEIPKYSTATHRRKFVIGHHNFERRRPRSPKTNHQVGANHWNWKGGVHNKDKTERLRFLKSYAPKVLHRDNYTCQVCFDYGIHLHVDHIRPWADYPELRFDLENCRSLCRPCHYYVTFKRTMPVGSKWGLTTLTRKRG